MKWKNRITNYNFWISLISASLLILQAFKFEFDIAYINEISTAVLGLLVVVGIISDPTKTYAKEESLTNAKITEEKIEEKKVEVKEEKATETEVEERSVIQMPTKDETENYINDDENDFKAVINKISEDIANNLERINQIQSSLLNELNSKTEDINPVTEANLIKETKEEVEIPVCLNIVN